MSYLGKSENKAWLFDVSRFYGLILVSFFCFLFSISGKRRNLAWWTICKPFSWEICFKTTQLFRKTPKSCFRICRQLFLSKKESVEFKVWTVQEKVFRITVLNISTKQGSILSHHVLFWQSLTPYEFVEDMKKKGIRVPGIGHRYRASF